MSAVSLVSHRPAGRWARETAGLLFELHVLDQLTAVDLPDDARVSAEPLLLAAADHLAASALDALDKAIAREIAGVAS